MVPEFANAAFSIEVGKVGAEPVQTQFGYHVIKVEDVRMREKPDFDAVKPQLEQQLRQAVVGEELQKLRQNAEITVYAYNGDPIQNEAPDDTEEETETSNEEPVDSSETEETPAE